MEKNRSTLQILINLFLPYMVLMVFFALTSLVLYTQSLKIAEEQIRQKNIFLLREVQSSMASFLEDSNKLFSHLIYQSSHFNLPRDREGATRQEISFDLYRVEALKNMPPVDIYQDFIQDYFILLDSPRAILNNEMSLPLDTYMRYTLGLNERESEELTEYFFDDGHITNYFSDIISLRTPQKGQSWIYQKGMVRKFGSDYGGPKGLIIIYMNTDNYFRELENIDISHGGGVFTLDRKGVIQFGLARGETFSGILASGTLDSRAREIRGKGSPWFVTEIESGDNPFSYTAVQSREYLREQTRGVRLFLISLISLLFIVGLVFSLFVVYFNSKPITRIFQEFQEKGIREREEVPILRGGFLSRLNFQVRELSRYLEQQKEHLEHNIMERLLNGYHIGEADYRNIVENSLGGNAFSYTVVLFSIRSHSPEFGAGEIREEGLWKSQINILLRTELRESAAFTFDRNPGEVILIFRETGENNRDMETCGEPLFRRIGENDFFDTVISLGGRVGGIDEISLSYEQAVRARDTSPGDDSSPVVRFTGRKTTLPVLETPVDLERKLTNSLISGDSPTLRKLFEEIYDKNLRPTNVSYRPIRILIDTLMGVLLGIMRRITLEKGDLENRIAALMEEEISLKNYRDLFRRLTEIMIEIAENRRDTQNDRKARMVREMCLHIDSHFSDPLLSADTVGSALAISGNYVYKLFKEYYGTSFHRYLEDLRMEYAKKLLAGESFLNIKEIASLSGYNSLNTFYKAFRKNSSMSAGDFRKNIGPLPK